MSTSDGQEQVPQNLTPEGQAIVQRLDEVIAALSSFSKDQTEVNEAVSNRLQQTDERLANHDELLAESRARFQQGEERLAKSESMLAELKEFNAEARARFQQGEERLAKSESMLAELKELNAEARSRLQQDEERLTNHDELIAESHARLQEGAERLAKSELHLGYLRGAHASNTARRDADLIADDMGYQLVDQLPRGMLISFANMARASGKHENDVRSFREADLIMLVRDTDGQPAYVAVEASFTIAARDIERAKRNAAYLHEFTGLKTMAAVAGVEITSGQRRNASISGVHCYAIPARDLEAD